MKVSGVQGRSSGPRRCPTAGPGSSCPGRVPRGHGASAMRLGQDHWVHPMGPRSPGGGRMGLPHGYNGRPWMGLRGLHLPPGRRGPGSRPCCRLFSPVPRACS